MKVEIDLFKTGAFPAIDLFTSGDTQVLGYKRIYVTSKGETRLARVDPDALTLTSFLGRTQDFPNTIDFTAAGASEALAELKDLLARARAGTAPLDVNRVLRLTRYFFWELEAALKLSILLAARQAGLSIPEPPSWEQLRNAWKARTPKGDVFDEIESLNFEWTGVDLFDARAYAELSRSAVIWSQSAILNSGPQKGSTIACSFEPPCREHGPQLFLPEGLDRFMDASRRFVQRLLHLSQAANVTDAA